MVIICLLLRSGCFWSGCVMARSRLQVFDDKYVCIEVDAASSDTKRLAARGIKAGGRVDTLRADGHTNL